MIERDLQDALHGMIWRPSLYNWLKLLTWEPLEVYEGELFPIIVEAQDSNGNPPESPR